MSGSLPLRVAVKGDSAVVWMSWMGGPRTDMTFPRALEGELRAAGRAAEVCVFATPSERTREGLGNWQRQLLGYSPDVVVLAYGLYDAIHLALPQWLQRHANSESWRPGPIRQRYRQELLRPAYKAVGRAQRRIDTPRWDAVNRRRGRRVADALEQLILRLQRVSSPLILVTDVLPPGPTWRDWFPGMGARAELINNSVAGMVQRLDRPDVRTFSVRDVVVRHLPAGEEPVPDGGHYTPALHRAIGVELARVIASWADAQPHLTP